MNCKKCKKEIPDNSVFCNYCGKKQVQTERKRAKRGNGTGTICKRSDLKTTPYMVLTPMDKNNNREPIGYYATMPEAKKALDEYTDHPTTKFNITLKEIYAEWKPLWLEGKSKQLKDSYNAAWDKLYTLYDMKFREIRTAQMQQIIQDLQKERPKLDKEHNPIIKDGQKIMLSPASYSTLSNVKLLMGLLYDYAMQNDIVNKDYSQYIILPKNEHSVKDRFNDLDLKKMEQHLDDVPFADCIYFLCYCGLRIEEFLSLNEFRVKNIDNIYVLYGGNKSAAGENKIIPVHSKIVPILEKWMNKKGTVIFCNPKGKKYSAKDFREKCYYPALEEMGLRKLSPHACRRTFSSRGHESGINNQDLIALMGHTDIQIDTDFYIKQSVESLKASIEKLS